MIDGTALWFGAAGSKVLDEVDDGVELLIEVETERRVVGCWAAGRATLRDAPAGRQFVRVRWRRRIWRCPTGLRRQRLDRAMSPAFRRRRRRFVTGVAIVVDPFHIVRVTNDALTRCRHRVQPETLEHRGWKGDPLDDVRKPLLLGAERVDDAGGVRIHAALDAGDPTAKYVTPGWPKNGSATSTGPTIPNRRRPLDAAIAWCAGPESGPERRRLAKMLRRWMTQILAHHRTGASKGPVAVPG